MPNFQNILTYIQHYKRLISYEREENSKAHMEEIRNLTPKQREAKGRAILSLCGKYVGRGLGGSFILKFVKYDRSKFVQNSISSSDLVIVTRDKKPKGNEMFGTVLEISNYAVYVSFPNRPPTNYFKDNLRLDLFSNDVAYQRQLVALSKLKARSELQRIVMSKNIDKNKLKLFFNVWRNEKLDESQRKAVTNSLISDKLFLLHGPPGTGKTTTLVESVLQHMQFSDKILITAESNIAVDNIIEKLSSYTKDIVRIGNPARIDEKIIDFSLDSKLERELFYKEAKAMYNEIDMLKEKQEVHGIVPTKEFRNGLSDKQIRRFAKKRKSAKNVPAPVLRKMSLWLNIQEQIVGLSKKAKIMEREAVNKILSKTKIICSTNCGAGSEFLEDFCNLTGTKFDVLFIDEASQATEPSCLIPMMFAKKYVLAGDHMQLPPTVLSKEAKDLQNTLFEKLIRRHKTEISSMLKVQYRMNSKIMNFPNNEFYYGKLKAHSSVANHTVSNIISKSYDYEKTSWLNETLKPQVPCVFLNTTIDNESFENRRVGSTSCENEKEVFIIGEIVEEFVNMGINEKDIGIITPYNDQVNLLENRLKNFKNLEIKSVDGFQGREKEVIIISFVRANEEGQIGFLSDRRRLNVAITRARRKLIMVGHKETLEKDDIYKKLILSSINTGFDV